MTLSPEAAESLFENIVASFERGERDTAMRLAVSALEQGLDEPLVLLLAGEALEEDGRGAEGIELLLEAAEIAPEEAQVWFCLGTMRIRQGLDEAGLADLETALSLQANFLPALANAAAVSYRLGHLTDAESYYRQLVALDPDSTDALAALAAIAARRRDTAQARAMASRALALQPGNFSAEMAIGRADLIDGEPERVHARMDRLLARSGLDDDARVAVLDLRADALDALDRTEAAFADYASRNAILSQKFAARMEREVSERSVDRARRLARVFSSQAAAPWQRHSAGPDEAGADAGCRHVFLLSFPRSGTTLLEKVLSSHSDVVALEEVDLLSDIASEWLAQDAGIDALAALGPREAAVHRARYWQGVRDATGVELSGRTVLDKLPLHTLCLPVIARLFPQAKILFAVRDPRDVVLSCFRRRFQVNPAMYELLDLRSAAQFYHEVMNLAEVCRAVLPIAVWEVRHEQMVEQFEHTVRRVLEFVGLEWQPALLHFADTLPADPRTPSDLQLRRGLNASGLGQWRRYSDPMAPVTDVLAPWVQRYGYTLNG
ncbi:MAG: sulfotransferase [Halioglobus sp.]|nr:sulfotransferase [Halioglobus sp.]